MEQEIQKDQTQAYQDTLVISSGQSSAGLIISSGGGDARRVLLSGGVMNETAILTGGALSANSGYISATLMSGAGAFLNAYNSASISQITIQQGTLYASNGVTVSGASLQTGGRMDVFSGASVGSAMIASAGRLVISSGASASEIDLLSGGLLDIRSGSVSGLNISRGNLNVSAGGVADDVQISDTAVEVHISAGGTLRNAALLTNSARVDVYNGAVAENIDVSAGRFLVSAGGAAFNASVGNNGSMELRAGSANGIELDSGARLYLSSGANADTVSAGSGAYIYMENGGVLQNAVIAEGGRIAVGATGSGGIYADDYETFITGSNARGLFSLMNGSASGFNVVSGVQYRVFSGGIMDDTLLGSAQISAFDGGTVSSIDLEDKAYLCISSGGALSGARISSGGAVEVYEYASASNVEVGSGARFYVYSGQADLVSVSGGIFVGSGGTLGNISVYENGNLELKSGASADMVTVNGAGRAYFYETCSAANLMNDGGIMIASGAGLQSAILSDGGSLELKSGATVDSVFMTGSATKAYFYETCTANELLNEGGIIVASGAELQSAALSDGGSLELKLGATVNSVFMTGSATKTYVYSECAAGGIENDGGIIVASGGTLGSVNMSNGASLELKSGAEVGAASIADPETKLYLYDSSVASSIDNDGAILIASGGFISSAVLSNGASLELKSGAVLESAAVIGGVFYVYNTARADIVDAVDAMMTISGGGIGNLMMTGGEMYVTEGGMLSAGTVTDGFLYVSSTGNVSGTTLFDGALMAVSNGAATDDIVVLEGATAGFYGGTACNTFIGSGGFAEFSLNGYEEVFSSAIASNTLVGCGGTLEMHSGTRHTGTLTIEGGAVCYFQSTSILDFNISAMSPGNDALVNDFSLVSGLPDCTVTISATQETGSYHLADGAVNISEIFTVVTTDGDIYGSLYVNEVIEYDSLYYSLTEDDGQLSFLISNEAPVISGLVKVYSSGVFISSASVMEDVLLQSDSTVDSMCILQGGSAVRTSVESGGSMVVSAEGGAFDTMLVSGGRIYVRSGGSAEGTVVRDGGLAFVSEGGRAIGNIVGSSGFVYVSSGAFFQTGEVRENGRVDILEGGRAENTAVLSGGRLIASSGASALNAAVFSGGNLEIRDGGVAGSAFIGELGRALVSSGGLAENAFVGSGGYMWINGGSCFGLDLAAGGSLTVFTEGGLIGGLIRANDAAVVTVIDTCELNFTVSGMVPGDDVLVNDLSFFMGDAFTYSLTVSPDQADGLYSLAEGAEDFDSDIAVQLTDGMAIGTIIVGGDLVFDDKVYTLTKADGLLSLNVTTDIPPVPPVPAEPPRVNLLENGVSQVLAWDAAQGKVGFMATDGNPAPSWRGVWEWPTEYNEYLGASEAALWKVVGAGHFSGSEVDYDGILLYNGIGNTFAAWTNLNDPSYGYVSLCHVDGNFQTKCLADFDGDGFDDVIIYNEVGSVGIVSGAAAYHDVWHVEGDSTEWSLLGAGSFNPTFCQDSILFKNTDNGHLYLWDNQGEDVGTWNWHQTDIGYLADGWEFAAIGDFAGDGIDDIALVNTNDNNAVFVWDDGDQSTQHYVGVLGDGFRIETVGDYDGDGKEDLLLREYNTGWGGIGCWSGADATAWMDFNARIETDMESRFAIIA